MRLLQRLVRARGLETTALIVLAGCSSFAGGGATPSAASFASASLGDASKTELFVSDSGTNDIDVFAWPKPKNPSGTLGGLDEPQGGCSDANGDVYFSNTADGDVLGFAVGNSRPIATLRDPGQYPVGCSYDWKHGNLAVANGISTSGGPGSVSIYHHETGSPTIVGTPLVDRFFAISYDDSGDLYASGQTSASEDVIVELPAGAHAFESACPKLAAKGLVVVGWDGRYVLFGDDDGIYRVDRCAIVGKTPVGDSGEVTVRDGRLAVTDDANATVRIYSYPAGRPLQVVRGFSEPIGLAIGGIEDASHS